MFNTLVEIPRELAPLWQPMRYKVGLGGRNGLKSWSFARVLLVLAAQRPLRILCTREVQRSIRESVHQLLRDQIQRLGLGAAYDVLDKEIRGANGSLFSFAGLSDQTAESIKSFEGYDIVWCEEARSITRRSYQILLPTIRKPGSEVWISFNPELDTDETYDRFVTNTPPDAVVMHVGWEAAERCGWLSKEAAALRKQDELTMSKEDYANIWGGKPRSAAIGAIYTEEAAYITEHKRYTIVDYDPELKVHLVLDLGWNDALTCALIQKHLSSLRCIGYIETSHKTLAWLSAELRLKRLNWGTMYLPHDGENKNIQTGQSAKALMEKLGWVVKTTPSVPVEMGIRSARQMLRKLWIARPADPNEPDPLGGTPRLLECIKRYRRAVNASTQQPGAPLHDEYSHGADTVRYIALNADDMSNEALNGGKPQQPDHKYT